MVYSDDSSEDDWMITSKVLNKEEEPDEEEGRGGGKRRLRSGAAASSSTFTVKPPKDENSSSDEYDFGERPSRSTAAASSSSSRGGGGSKGRRRVIQDDGEEEEDEEEDDEREEEEEEEEESDFGGCPASSSSSTAAAASKNRGRGGKGRKRLIRDDNEEEEEEEDDEEEEDEDDDIDMMKIAPPLPEDDEPAPEGDVSQVFAHYKPHKFKIGRPHPGKVVETTVLARAIPPDVWYEFHPDMQPAIDSGNLSNLQLESIVYACQQHERTKVNEDEDGNYQVGGFFLGDAAGVGKGRTIAGLILENWQRGRKKAMWFSVSGDLYHDAQRDLRDVGAGVIPTLSLTNLKYDDPRLKNFKLKRGILFVTYATCVGKAKNGKTRVDQIVEWVGKEFNGCLVFDEGHNAKKLIAEVDESKKSYGKKKNGGSTKTALSVQELQTRLSKARVLYCSATGASALENLAYMTRLGLYGWENGSLFDDQEAFFKCPGLKNSVGALELIAMGLKTSGKYTARSLSFADTTFKIEPTPVDDTEAMKYDSCTRLWYEVLEIMNGAAGDLASGQAGYDSINVMETVDRMWAFTKQYWSSHQRFFRHMIIASKVSHVVELSKAAIKDGKCVVIGLLSTGEASAQRYFKSRQARGLGSNRPSSPPAIAGGGKEEDRRSRRGRRVTQVNYREADITDSDDKEEDSSVSRSGGRGRARKSKTPPAGGDRTSGGSGSSSGKKAVRGGGGQGKDSKKRRRDDDSDEDYDGSKDHSEDEEDSDFSDSSPVQPRGGGRGRGPPALASSSGGGSSSSAPKPAWDDDDDDDAEDEFEVDDAFVGVETGLIEIIKKYVPDRGQGTLRGEAFNYATKKKDLINMVKRQDLPQFPLDTLIRDLGGSDAVAEITGRKSRLVLCDDGDHYEMNRAQELGCTHKEVNRVETKNFMSGKKLVAIISDAGSTGISLHADRRAKNQRRRVHITLELPFDSQQLVQQLGRSHRSNQASGPEYVCVISELPGEMRFASTAAKRLMAMGAITQGDRQACMGSSELAEFDLDNRWGTRALKQFFGFIISDRDIDAKYLPLYIRDEQDPVARAQSQNEFQQILRSNLCLVDLAKPYQAAARNPRERGRGRRGRGATAAFLRGGTNDNNEEDDEGGTGFKARNTSISRFLNRLLGLAVEEQHNVFSCFESIHAQTVEDAKVQGRHDVGVVDVYAERILQVTSHELIKMNGFPVVLHTIKWDRGFTFEKAVALRKEHSQTLREHRRKSRKALGDGKMEVEEEEEGEDYDGGTGTGFYINERFPAHIILALELPSSAFKRQARAGSYAARFEKIYKIVCPNSGHRGHQGAYFLKDWTMSGRDLSTGWEKIQPGARASQAAEKTWTSLYTSTLKSCLHQARGDAPGGMARDANGTVREKKGNKECFLNENHVAHKPQSPWCPVGRREGESFILSGNVVSLWPLLEEALIRGSNKHVQVVRCVRENGKRYVGLDVPRNHRNELFERIAAFREQMGGGDNSDEEEDKRGSMVAIGAEVDDHDRSKSFTVSLEHLKRKQVEKKREEEERMREGMERAAERARAVEEQRQRLQEGQRRQGQQQLQAALSQVVAGSAGSVTAALLQAIAGGGSGSSSAAVSSTTTTTASGTVVSVGGQPPAKKAKVTAPVPAARKLKKQKRMTAAARRREERHQQAMLRFRQLQQAVRPQAQVAFPAPGQVPPPPAIPRTGGGEVDWDSDDTL